MKLDNELRAYLADRYGCDAQADIETDGQCVHVTAVMPNTNHHGTFYAGDLADIQRDMESDRRDWAAHAREVRRPEKEGRALFSIASHARTRGETVRGGSQGTPPRIASHARTQRG